MKEKANYLKKKIDVFLAFRRKAKIKFSVHIHLLTAAVSFEKYCVSDHTPGHHYPRLHLIINNRGYPKWRSFGTPSLISSHSKKSSTPRPQENRNTGLPPYGEWNYRFMLFSGKLMSLLFTT